MSVIVQKFGGTSVASTEKILAAARKAIRAHNDGHQVVMVVSAMGKNTDMLVGLAGEITDRPPAREMDMLLSTGEQVSVALMAMAVHSLGYEAISLTGAQIGIVTDSSHTRARIQSISTERMEKLLGEGKIIIAAGFQGVDEDFNITTLGRGGSDTTAVALAAVLKASSCEIYTDVDGVYTTDPRVVPEARRVGRISYDEMLELASVGAGVMHNRSIEFAKKFGVDVHVRSSGSDAPGTLIVAEPESIETPVCGAALAKDEARITILGVPDRPGAAESIFTKIAGLNVPIDMIVQNVADDGKASISFTVQTGDAADVMEATEEGVKEIGAESVSCDKDVAKVSVVGLGMEFQSGVADRMFRSLADRGVNILMITTSEIKISVLVHRDDAVEALRAVHSAFELSKEPETRETHQPRKPQVSQAETVDIVARLETMEDLIIEDVVLDESQARVTMPSLPDKPGLAAELFEKVATEGIVVDMIVQSVGEGGRADISFTVSKDVLDRAYDVACDLAKEFGAGKPTQAPDVAKLSVLGTGMKSHTGVATRTFHSLAGAGVNVGMISTSEVRVNVVVHGEDGREALKLLRKEFENVML